MDGTSEVILRARDLAVLSSDGTPLLCLDALDIHRGDRIAIVGASGSGKSVLVQALAQWVPELGKLPKPPRGPVSQQRWNQTRRWGRATHKAAGSETLHMSGTVEYSVDGRSLTRDQALSILWQDSLQALNPTRTVGWQLEQTLQRRGRDRAEAPSWLERVGMHNPALAMRSYPHQLSGGMRQRVAIALALCGGQPVVIADEPTTALDTVRQAEILRLIDAICTEEQRTLLMCTHDIAVASQLCDQVMVVDDGAIVDHGTWAEVFGSPRCSAAASLKEHLRQMPAIVSDSADYDAPKEPRVKEPRVRLRAVSFRYGDSDASEGVRGQLTRKLRGHGHVNRLKDVDLELEPSKILGIVGASGCGKTTLASLVVGLHEPTSGSVEIAAEDGSWRRPKDYRPRVQMVFQSPYSVFNPRRRVGESLIAAARAGTKIREVDDLVRYWVNRVNVPFDTLQRRPHAVSGGQLQRLALARALLARPTVLVADEVVSALDLAHQDRILELLATATEDLGIATVLISHDLSAVAAVSDRIAVMDTGRVVECGTCEEILRSEKPETRQLFEAIPQFEWGSDLGEQSGRGEVSS